VIGSLRGSTLCRGWCMSEPLGKLYGIFIFIQNLGLTKSNVIGGGSLHDPV
jgi:hypothetical protein